MLPLWVNRTNQCSVFGLKRAKEEKMESERERERACSYLKKNFPKNRKFEALDVVVKFEAHICLWQSLGCIN